MKLTISILFCVILTLQYNGADGERKGLFGRIQGTVNKVKQDVNNLFHPDEKKQQAEEESSNIHFKEDEPEKDFAAAFAARKPVEPAAAPVTTSTILIATTTLSPITTTAKNETEKDGRENFAGGCVTGFMRTPDGRCKPTF